MYENVSALTEVRAYGAERWDFNRMIAAYHKYKNTRLKSLLYRHLRFSNRMVAISIGLLLLYVLGSDRVVSGTMSIGELTSFAIYASLAMGSFGRIFISFMEQTYILQQAHRLIEFMRLKMNVADSDNPISIGPVEGNIEFDQVSFSYQSRAGILRDFSLRVRPGESVALVGESGCGKSTVLKLIGRFYDPAQGEVRLDDVSLSSLPLAVVRDSVGYVFQETFLFGSSIRDNIRFGNPKASDEEIEAAARAAFAHDFIIQMEQGYDTLVGERGVRLSGGQRQRIAIARLFLKNPPIVILDEATSALDNVSEQEVMKAINSLLFGRTTIAVAHRMSSIRNFDRILVMHLGQIIEEGTYEDLLQAKGAFYQLVEGERTG